MYCYTHCGIPLRNCFWIYEMGLLSVNDVFGKTMGVNDALYNYFLLIILGIVLKIYTKSPDNWVCELLILLLCFVWGSLALCTFLFLLHWVMDLYFLVMVTFCPCAECSSKPLWGNWLKIRQSWVYLPVCADSCMHILQNLNKCTPPLAFQEKVKDQLLKPAGY